MCIVPPNDREWGAHCRSYRRHPKAFPLQAFLLQAATETRIMRCPPPWTLYPIGFWKMARNMYVGYTRVEHAREVCQILQTYTPATLVIGIHTEYITIHKLLLSPDVWNGRGTGLQSSGGTCRLHSASALTNVTQNRV